VIEIGKLIRRQRSGAKWHFVESVVAGAAITRCGRRMEPENGSGKLDADPILTGAVYAAKLVCQGCS
jgi:hypothetical protein